MKPSFALLENYIKNGSVERMKPETELEESVLEKLLKPHKSPLKKRELK
jgi:hypothetical protein